MFKRLAKFSKIIVSGPQRSGTRITAKMIARDLQYWFIDEREIKIDSFYSLLRAIGTDGVVVQCPALSSMLHFVGGNEDVAIVFCIRDIDDIIKSQERINWTNQWEPIEKAFYGNLNDPRPISKIKYDFLEATKGDYKECF